MDKQRLLEILKEIVYRNDSRDAEEHHLDADAALLDYIDDHDVTKAFDDIEKWYA